MKFELSCLITVSAYTIVEADNLEDAIRIANDRGNMLIVSDPFNDPEEVWTIDELDGTPTEIHEA